MITLALCTWSEFEREFTRMSWVVRWAVVAVVGGAEHLNSVKGFVVCGALLERSGKPYTIYRQEPIVFG